MTAAVFAPAVGQRWISDTETELGLGVMIEVDARSLTVLFPKSEETRVYARNNAPLSRIRFAEGDAVHDVAGTAFTVVSVEDQRGLLRYTVKNAEGVESVLNETRLAADIHLSRPQERLLASQLDNNELFNLRVQALLQRERLAQSPVRGLIGPRLGKVPHQFYIAHEVGTRPQPRVLLGDEVGLGKTIEAGLIIHQQLQTGRAGRVLILVPENLQYQWLVEMRRRFNLNCSLFDLERCAAIKESDEDANPFETEQIVLMAQELAVDHPHIEQALTEAQWDLLVVDEAHHLEWSPEDASPAYELVETLAAASNGVLLLTATPEHLGVASHFARLRLLDPARYHDLEVFIEEEESFAAVASAAGELLADAPLSAAADATLREKLPAALLTSLDSREGRRAALAALLDRHGTGRVLFRNTREAIGGFPERQCLPVALEGGADTADLTQSLYPEMSAEDDNWVETDSRVEWLGGLMKKLKRDKILLICRSSPVALALEEYLRLKQGVRTSVFHEGMSLIERDRAAAYFADADYGAQVLLCSEIGSEGRNFQFAHHLVLFDLPADPELLEQRIGRLDRIGQQDTIRLHVPYFSGTAQERLFRWYHEALDAFESISPTARTLVDEFRSRLRKGIAAGGDEFEQLLVDARNRRDELLADLEQGRDRLIELNSCRKDEAAALIAALEAEDDNARLPEFLERSWSAFGIDQEEQLESHLHILRPGDHQLLEGFPGLDPEGMTVSFSRDYSLSREDVHFLSWEHPMAQGLLDLFHSQEYGNANIALIRNKGIKPGTLLVELFFRLEVVAPRGLNIEAALPSLVQRVLLDHHGRELGDKVSHDTLVKQLQPLDRSVGRQLVKQQQELLEKLLAQAAHSSEKQLPALRAAALERWRGISGAEIERLKALAAINPGVRPQEIRLLEQRLAEGEKALEDLRLVAHAVRLIVAA
ncbi:MAG: polymerase-associated protein RapA [Moraxellaceae bacterium]|jgi:ATP-dependent helicase HepA|nr:polymerase-associated protein RapA [Moraxellaceae bacterium]